MFRYDMDSRLWLEMDVPDQRATVRVPARLTEVDRDLHGWGFDSRPRWTFGVQFTLDRIVGEDAHGRRATLQGDYRPLTVRAEITSDW